MKYSYEDVDERIVKTKIALSDALLVLLKENRKIKVLDICQKANITPMTYYHHFDNKEQLIEYTINNQLQNILPIPTKLKPINLKHLIYYLINSLSEFVKTNRDVFYCSIKQIETDRFVNSYLFLVFKTIISLVEKEISLLLKNKFVNIQIINNIVCGSLLNSFFQMIVRNSFINSSMIWNTFKTINVLLK